MKRSISLALVLWLLASLPLLCESRSPNLTELQSGWRMAAADSVQGAGSAVSQPDFDASRWYAIQKMPATVLQTLVDNRVYRDVYRGMNLATEVPQDLWKKHWWYRTTFAAPGGKDLYSLIFKGINYRADIWLNGHLIADHTQMVGMYSSFELDVSKYIHPGGDNVLAVEVTPEQKLMGINGVELADSWLDWINWKYIGYHDREKKIDIPFVPDRNAGVWKRVYLSSTGKVTIRNPYVKTDLPLPGLTPAALTVYCDLHNGSAESVSGTLSGEILRQGKPSIAFQTSVTLAANATREITLSPADVAALSVDNPDLWWPYQWGEPNLYQLRLDFRVADALSDSESISFGIRKVTQHRDSDESFPKIGKGGNFYLQINGKDFLVRGAVYTPDLLFKNDPEHDRAVVRYVKDLGLNLLRWELKIADEDMIDLADREGIPTMLGWMCCAQWEHWKQWDEEDYRVAHASMQARIRELRSHPSVVIWANGSDGLPPDPVRNDYHKVLDQMHWQNAAVDTVSNYNQKRHWDGIHMVGPYVWRPPYYWFSDKFGPARGSSAEEGDNETIPPLESLRKFLPADKLWPINEDWYFHSGANDGNNTLSSITRAVDHRYGHSSSAAEFSKKAQLAHYENVRAQFENYGASGWSNHKMMVYWMLNSQWPSFFGHLFDYYLKPGGGYFGAKKALQPLSVVYDYYATGDRSHAKVYVVNQTLEPLNGLKVSVKFYDIDGHEKSSNEVKDFRVGASTSAMALTMPRVGGLTSTYFIRCQLRDASDRLLADNVYWQSTADDNVSKDRQFTLDQNKWADYSALNSMAPAEVSVSAHSSVHEGNATTKIVLTNNSDHIAFFLRAEITRGDDGEEILPITYEDNYITLFPRESRTIQAGYQEAALSGQTPALRLEGYNVGKQIAAIHAGAAQ